MDVRIQTSTLHAAQACAARLESFGYAAHTVTNNGHTPAEYFVECSESLYDEASLILQEIESDVQLTLNDLYPVWHG